MAYRRTQNTVVKQGNTRPTNGCRPRVAIRPRPVHPADSTRDVDIEFASELIVEITGTTLKNEFRVFSAVGSGIGVTVNGHIPQAVDVINRERVTARERKQTVKIAVRSANRRRAEVIAVFRTIDAERQVDGARERAVGVGIDRPDLFSLTRTGKSKRGVALDFNMAGVAERMRLVERELAVLHRRSAGVGVARFARAAFANRKVTHEVDVARDVSVVTHDGTQHKVARIGRIRIRCCKRQTAARRIGKFDSRHAVFGRDRVHLRVDAHITGAPGNEGPSDTVLLVIGRAARNSVRSGNEAFEIFFAKIRTIANKCLIEGCVVE